MFARKYGSDPAHPHLRFDGLPNEKFKCNLRMKGYCCVGYETSWRANRCSDLFRFSALKIVKFSSDDLPLIGIFSICAPPPPNLAGAFLFAPHTILLHNDSLCNGTCSVTGGA